MSSFFSGFLYLHFNSSPFCRKKISKIGNRQRQELIVNLNNLFGFSFISDGTFQLEIFHRRTSHKRKSSTGGHIF